MSEQLKTHSQHFEKLRKINNVLPEGSSVHKFLFEYEVHIRVYKLYILAPRQ